LLSSGASTGITLGWNYLDGLFDFFLAAKHFHDIKDYRRTQHKTQGILSVLCGVQLFVLSYNPLVTTYVGLDSETSLAASSFALAALLDLCVAILEFYNVKKEMEFQGWLDTQVKKLVYTIHHEHQQDELIRDIHSCATDYIATYPNRLAQVKNTLTNNLPLDHPGVNHMINNLDVPTEAQTERSRQVQLQLNQTYKANRTNLTLKAASFVGMTLLAITRFLDDTSSSANVTLVMGLALSTYVAAAYLAYNSDRLMNNIGHYSNRFFTLCRPADESVSVPQQLATVV